MNGHYMVTMVRIAACVLENLAESRRDGGETEVSREAMIDGMLDFPAQEWVSFGLSARQLRFATRENFARAVDEVLTLSEAGRFAAVGGDHARREGGFVPGPRSIRYLLDSELPPPPPALPLAEVSEASAVIARFDVLQIRINGEWRDCATLRDTADIAIAKSFLAGGRKGWPHYVPAGDFRVVRDSTIVAEGGK